MKAVITCRFQFDGVGTDNEAGCRFFFEKRANRWGFECTTLLSDEDKTIPVNTEEVG
jgi:hypothetical protein